MEMDVYEFEYEVKIKFYAVVIAMFLSVLAKMVRENDHEEISEETVKKYVQQFVSSEQFQNPMSPEEEEQYDSDSKKYN